MAFRHVKQNFTTLNCFLWNRNLENTYTLYNIVVIVMRPMTANTVPFIFAIFHPWCVLLCLLKDVEKSEAKPIVPWGKSGFSENRVLRPFWEHMITMSGAGGNFQRRLAVAVGLSFCHQASMIWNVDFCSCSEVTFQNTSPANVEVVRWWRWWCGW